MSAPQRIQRQRTKGWRMSEGAIYVGRPSRWGNPFTIGGFYFNRGPWDNAPFPAEGPERTRYARNGFTREPYLEVVAHIVDGAHAVELFAQHVRHYNVGAWDAEDLRVRLGGHDLACWCRLDQPCHADVLLSIANPQEVPA